MWKISFSGVIALVITAKLRFYKILQLSFPVIQTRGHVCSSQHIRCFVWARPVLKVNAHCILVFSPGFPRLTQQPLSESRDVSPALDFHPGGSGQVLTPSDAHEISLEGLPPFIQCV